MGVDDLSKFYFKEKLVKYIIRKSLGLSVDDIDLVGIVGSTNYPLMKRVVDKITLRLVTEKNNHLRCGLCGKGPFTKRGLYLHMMRKHYNDVIRLVDEIISEYSS